MEPDFRRMTEPELRELDTQLASRENQWWDSFYQDRAKPCPFFGTSPDESLATWVREGVLQPGRAMDLGCGNGRNAIFLARHGFAVEAVDYSRSAIDWAGVRAAESGVAVSLTHGNVFDLNPAAGSFDLIYDSGCFHHIPPHRRSRYVDLVVNALRPGGWFGLACFRPEGGSGYSDNDVYAHRSLGGGLGYAEERLRDVWSDGLQVCVLRPMEKPDAQSGLFGESFLWAMLARKV